MDNQEQEILLAHVTRHGISEMPAECPLCRIEYQLSRLRAQKDAAVDYED